MNDNNLKYGLLIFGTLIIVWLISFLLRKVLDFFIKKNSKKLFVDPTNFIFLKNSISFVLFNIGLFWVFTKIPYFKTLGTALFASAGVFAAIIGFASQKAFANIIGGIFILIFKPFRIGDALEIANGQTGIVEEITLRHTVIKDYQFRRIVIPNSIISEETIINSNLTDQKIRKQIDIQIAYDTNLEVAEKIIQNIIKNHPFHIDNRTIEEKNTNESSVPIKVTKLGEYSITLKAFVWAKNFDTSIELERDVFRSVKLAFDKKGIEIPFPHRTIVFKNDINKPKDGIEK